MPIKKSLNTIESIKWFGDGNILAHPTEGVWGLGCNALDASAYRSLFSLKKRDTKNSFILLCRSLQSIKKYIQTLSLSDESLLNNTWPGPVTFVIRYNNAIPEHLKNDTGKLAFRVSNHYPIKALLKDFDGLFASTSANISGEPILQFPQEIIDIFANDNLAYYDEKLGKEMKPSTIIDLETKKILRH